MSSWSLGPEVLAFGDVIERADRFAIFKLVVAAAEGKPDSPGAWFDSFGGWRTASDSRLIVYVYEVT
ncbi:MAG: hypothetical protein ACKVVT_13565 [Dehalococcoidia bacterium]